MGFKKSTVMLIFLGLVIGFLTTKFAGTSSGNVDVNSTNTGDTAWVLIASALVMIMTPAVGFFMEGWLGVKM